MLDANNHRGKFAEDYVRTLASAAGLIVWTPDKDVDGLDLHIRVPGRSGVAARPMLDVQVKSWSTPKESRGSYAFDGLDEVQYNHLAVDDYTVPRLLFVVIVPPDSSTYADLYTGGTLLRYRAHYVSLHNEQRIADPCKNRNKRVHLPKANLLTVRAFRGMLGLDASVGVGA